MIQRHLSLRLAAVCAVMAFVAAGCFQQVNDNPQSTQVSQFIPTATFTETLVPPPTETPTETPTEDSFAPTNTPRPTATPTLTATPSPTRAVVDQPVSDIVGGTAVAQVDGEDEFVLTATQYVREITQTAEFSATQTAIAQGIGATETPFIPPTPSQQVPIFSTATPGGFATQPVSIGGTCVHEVRAGETLFRLSMTYGVSVADLAAASGITNPQLILIGQRINVPGCGTTGAVPPATSQPTQAFNASAQFGTGGSTLGQTVQIQTADGEIVQGQLITGGGQGGGAATSFATTHVVQQYETLFQISQRYGVSVNSIAAANGIGNINVIIMGDTLNIPAQ